MEKKSIFRKESIDRIASPERLDDYIRVSNSGAWIAVIALILVAVGVIVWGVTGVIPQTMEVNGFVEENLEVSCYIAADILPEGIVGRSVEITDTGVERKVKGRVESVSAVPFSAEEAYEMVASDWLRERLILADYVYKVVVQPEEENMLRRNTMVDVVIITSETKPISYLFN